MVIKYVDPDIKKAHHMIIELRVAFLLSIISGIVIGLSFFGMQYAADRGYNLLLVGGIALFIILVMFAIIWWFLSTMIDSLRKLMEEK